MITVYTHPTPNGFKVPIALEEMGLAYEIALVDVTAGEGQTQEFLAMSPAGKIPVIRDGAGGPFIYESNAILLHLSARSGRLMPVDADGRREAMQLLFLQASLQGPMFGQRAMFSAFFPEKVPAAIARYEEQGAFVDSVAERLLAGREFFLRSGFSIVDVSYFAWYRAAIGMGFTPQDCPSLLGWYARVAERPAVKRGIAALSAFEHGA